MALEDLIQELTSEIKELKATLGKLQITSQSEKTTFKSKDAAKYLGIGYTTLLKLANDGEIVHTQNGTYKIFTRQALDNWLAKKEQETFEDGNGYTRYLKRELRKGWKKVTRKNTKGRKVDKPRKLKARPNIRIIDTRTIMDRISPGRLVAAAEYVER